LIASGWQLSAVLPADIDVIVELERRCFSLPWGWRSIASEMTGRGAGGLALRAGKDEAPAAIVAYIFFRVIVDEVHIHRVAVAPEWRRRGLGSLLLAECLRSARRRGATAAILEVRPSSVEAIALYRKLGFQAIATRPGYYPDRVEDALILKMQIKEDL
jgi:ribosomal-protein-alanine N-acetyltransferase